MTPDEKEGRRNFIRYGLFVVVVMALVVTPTILYLAAAATVDIVWQTLVVVAIVAIVVYLVYLLYERFLENQ